MEPDPAAAAMDEAPRLVRFFARRGHGDDAEDLAQDLFVLLLSKGDRVDASHPGRFRSFLYALAYRIGANATRRRRARREEPLPAADASRAPDAAGPDRRLLSAESVRRAASALDALPAGTRRALLLVAEEGLTTREAARVLGVSEEVVRARLCRGRRRLAALLEETP